MNHVFLTVRVLHIIGAALWLGAVVFVSMFLMPVLQQAGPEGGKIMAGLERRGLTVFMGSIGGITVLTGFYLYWHLTGGFDPALAGSMEARVFGTGGVLGLVALIIGGGVIGRNIKKAQALGAKMASMADKDRAAAAAEMQKLRQTVLTFSRVVIALLVITIVLMSVGHYV